MKTRMINQEVLYADEDIVTVCADNVHSWKKSALSNSRQRIRLCAHRSEDDEVHEMIIVHTCNTYVRPHKHQNKSESFHVIEGLVDVILFDDDGAIVDIIEMGDYNSERCFFYRIAAPIYHTLIIHSEVLIFHETTKGPFNRESTVFATWSPNAEDTEGVQRYTENLKSSADELKEDRRNK